MQRGGGFSYRVIGATVVIVALVCVVIAGVLVTRSSPVHESRGFGNQSQNGTTSTSSSPSADALKAALTFTPASGASEIAPDEPIVVKAGAGHLTNVAVSASSGESVAGGLSWSGDQWRSRAPLTYNTVYHVTATVVSGAHTQAQSTATFQTVAPGATYDAAVFPHTGLSVGVGQPVAIRFSRDIVTPEARAELLAHVSVTESKAVAGGWHWFSNREVHFRPKAFWPTGEHVSVSWNLTGWSSGDGAWGVGDGISNFTVGDSRVSYANLATHVMTVTLNGRTISTYPISGGKPTDPTMNGVHIVLDRESVVEMNSATNGVPVNSPDGYDELVYNDVHISDTGEYVHAAPWSVGSQGHSNVSHGCINLSPANAASFFAFSRVGDVVVVSGSVRPPVVGDHGVMDWDTGWSQFTSADVAVPVPAGLTALY